MNTAQVGYGATYTTDEVAYKSVSAALESGYRLINTCPQYENEHGMGQAIAASGIPREELTIISLDSNTKRSSANSEEAENFDGYKAQTAQIYNSLDCLAVDYIDFYMIHWPVPRYMENVWERLNADSWRAMEDCVAKGLIRHIGVSNFLPHHLTALKKTAKLPIAVNQLEIHPQFRQCETALFCREQGIDIMAWSPLFKGQSVNLPEIIRLAEKYGKTPAQIILRWDIQNGIIPVVCSLNPRRIKSNFDVFGFIIEEDDMQIINSLETGEHVDVFSYKRQLESIKGAG